MNIKSTLNLRNAILAFAVFIFASCGSENQTENNDSEANTVDSTAIGETNTEEEDVNISLPSPLQIASIFKRSGLSYIEGLTNPSGNTKNYSSNNSKALNLGIYTSDLAYCVLNKQNQLSINYLKASRELANQLGMGSIFEANDLSKRFEANISREDSLASIIAELQMQSDLFLEENEMEHMSAIIFAGAWIESMYIGAKVYEKTNNEKITARIVEQMTILESIVKVLKIQESKDPSITSLIAQLTSINDIYNGFESVKAQQSAKENEEYSSPTLTAENLKALTAKISEVRTKIVSE